MRSPLLALCLTVTVLSVTGCYGGDEPTCEGTVFIENASGHPVVVTFEATDQELPAETVELTDDSVLGDAIDLPEGSYRVRAVSTDTNTVLYDSQLVGSTLVLEGCSDSAVVNVPAPAPQAECVAGGQHGPWTRIDLATPTSGVLPACVSGELVMEARDACGNFLSEINSPASWLNSDPTALSLFPAIGFTDLDFHAGYAKVRFVSNNSIQPTLTVVAGGLVSPSARLTIERSNTLSHLQIVPYTILAVGPDYGILCVGGYPNPPYVEVQAVTACSDLFVPSEPIQVFLKSSEGLFPAVELSLTAANNGRATYTLPTIPTALEEDTFQANGADGLLSAPIRLLFERDCASAGI